MKIDYDLGDKKSLFTGIAILLIFFGSVMLFNYFHNRVDRVGIENAVHDVVSKGLLNPSGAKFSDDSNTTITKSTDSDGYIVQGYVDDTNAFGATIRNNYMANVTKQGDGSYSVTYQLQNAVTGEWQ